MTSARDPNAQFSTFQRRLLFRADVMHYSITPPSSENCGEEAAFSVTLQCKVKRTAKAGGRRQPVQAEYEGDGANRTFNANQAVDIPLDH